MPDQSSKVVAYAAGASLAAATLVYVYGPTIFPDYRHERKSAVGESPSTSGFVGLLNPANDCFINSVLQALAGLHDLRIFLRRELDRRSSNCNEEGIITVALKEILENLNESPSHKKIISAQRLIKSLEHVHHARISRHQQDAQEFFLAIAEKLNDEWVNENKVERALGRETWTSPRTDDGRSTKGFANNSGEPQNINPVERKLNTQKKVSRDLLSEKKASFHIALEKDDYPGKFPFGGGLESQIECLTCHYKPKATNSTFVSLTLPVPAKSSTSLDSCFDSLTKVEHIEDYRCEACRLNHALTLKERALLITRNSETLSSLRTDITIIRNALENDPEKIEGNAHLPPVHDAPKRRIMRYTRICRFPQILAIHLSRSLYGVAMSATKNTARVSFPVVLPLGELLHRTTYSLRGIVTHKGGHQSGHYESYRLRGLSTELPLASLYSSSSKRRTNEMFIGNTESALNHSLGTQKATQSMAPWRPINVDSSTQQSLEYGPENIEGHRPEIAANANVNLDISLSNRNQLETFKSPDSTALDVIRSKKVDVVEKSQVEQEEKATLDAMFTSSLERKTRRKHQGHRNSHPSATNEAHHDDRWWRISDEKAWEVRTSDVLAMQKEVYLLFYERSI